MKKGIFNRIGEKGQALVLLALAVIVIFGFAAFAIDVGHLYHVKDQLQVAADASALAGAAELDGSTTVAQAAARDAAQRIGGKNVADVAYNDVPALAPFSAGATKGVPVPVALVRNDGNDDNTATSAAQ